MQPNVIRVRRVFSTMYTLSVLRIGSIPISDQCRYLIEDLITGGDLQSYIDREMLNNSSVDGEDACAIVYQILKALSYLHEEG